MIKHTEVMKLALEALTKNSDRVTEIRAKDQAITALREALTSVPDWASEAKEQPAPVAKPRKQEPVAWMPIEQMYPQSKAIDILMGDGSILCAVLPQFDGDLWWEGSGTGEKFIDPKYANVTHWRIHDERTSPPAQRKPWVGLTDDERLEVAEIDGADEWFWKVCKAIEAKLKEKNT